MNRINPEHQNIQINLNSDDDAVHSNELQSDSDLSFQFNRTIEIPPDYNVNLSLNQIEIPHSFYTFDDDIGLEVFYKQGIVQTGYPLSINILIPKGFYTISSLKSLVSKALKASTNTVLPPSWDSSFSSSTLKWSWSFPSTAGYETTETFAFSWFGARAPLSAKSLTMLQRFFGMPDTAGAVWTSSVGVNQYLASTNIADSTRYHNIYITAESFSTASMDSNDSASESVLCKVPVNAPFGSIINYKGSIDDGYLYQMRSLNMIKLSLKDHRGKLIELNGGRFNLSILLQFLKRNFSSVRNTIPTAIPAGPIISSVIPTPPQNQNAISKGVTPKGSKSTLKQRVKSILKKKRTKPGS